MLIFSYTYISTAIHCVRGCAYMYIYTCKYVNIRLGDYRDENAHLFIFIHVYNYSFIYVYEYIDVQIYNVYIHVCI